MSDINRRLERLFVALKVTRRTDFEKFPAQVYASERSWFMYQDFRGRRSDAELELVANQLLSEIAHLEGYFRRWARGTSRGVEVVDETIRNSRELQIVIDLANRDKHGGDAHKSRSRLNPSLKNIDSHFSLTAPGGGPASVLTFGQMGIPKTNHAEGGCVEVTADVVDGSGNFIDYLPRICSRAIQAWEHLHQR
jgi:hypothetical protein